MLFTQVFLERIAAGRVTLAYRRWRRPTVKAGGWLRTEVGELAIDSIEPIRLSSVTEADAKRAGYDSLAELSQALFRYPTGDLYRIAFRLAGPDSRITLREKASLSDGEVEQIKSQLARLDAASRRGPWTAKVLRAIEQHPGLPAGELAAKCGLEKECLKVNVRKLKERGLTESLQPGYRLSPRGRRFVVLAGIVR